MKKIIAVLIAALTISSFGLIANADTVYLLGDTDKSGEATLNSADLAYLKKVLLGTERSRYVGCKRGQRCKYRGFGLP